MDLKTEKNLPRYCGQQNCYKTNVQRKPITGSTDELNSHKNTAGNQND